MLRSIFHIPSALSRGRDSSRLVGTSSRVNPSSHKLNYVLSFGVYSLISWWCCSFCGSLVIIQEANHVSVRKEMIYSWFNDTHIILELFSHIIKDGVFLGSQLFQKLSRGSDFTHYKRQLTRLLLTKKRWWHTTLTNVKITWIPGRTGRK